MSKFDEVVDKILACTLCSLSSTRINAVPGEGSKNADIVFIGEGPGFHEDKRGIPFVGPAGRFLDELLASIGLSRNDVYITNVVKCRPPDNRDPLPEEVDSCKPYLDTQIDLISPKLIVTLGRHSMSWFFPGYAISKVHGKPRLWNGITMCPMYHPAAALHNPNLRSVIQNDFKELPNILARLEDINDDPEEQTKQLSMF